jgi:uncharacterized membrane protein
MAEPTGTCASGAKAFAGGLLDLIGAGVVTAWLVVLPVATVLELPAAVLALSVVSVWLGSVTVGLGARVQAANANVGTPTAPTARIVRRLVPPSFSDFARR